MASELQANLLFLDLTSIGFCEGWGQSQVTGPFWLAIYIRTASVSHTLRVFVENTHQGLEPQNVGTVHAVQVVVG